MKNEQWQYKIGGGLQGVILSAVMLAAFAGLSIWLYISKNGAFLFGMILSTVMFFVFLLTVYRAVFVKVLISQNGFYHQTRPGNGKYYDYGSIKKAWVSSGKNINGTESNYCNYETFDGEVVKFPFFTADSEGIDYLLSCVNDRAAAMAFENLDENRQEYKIDGKNNGKAGIVVVLVLLAVFIVLDIQLMRYGAPMIVLALGTVFLLATLIVLLVRYFCFEVRIGSTGFYFQSNPFNGKYYEYSDIESCKEEMRVYRHRHRRRHGGTRRAYYFYFVFTEKGGKTRRFQFEKPIYEHEIKLLTARIENARN